VGEERQGEVKVVMPRLIWIVVPMALVAQRVVAAPVDGGQAGGVAMPVIDAGDMTLPPSESKRSLSANLDP
jgi:hypothetical protein